MVSLYRRLSWACAAGVLPKPVLIRNVSIIQCQARVQNWLRALGFVPGFNDLYHDVDFSAEYSIGNFSRLGT